MEEKVFLLLFLSGLCAPPCCCQRRYVLVEVALTWSQAVDWCRERHSDLASIHSQDELDQAVEVSNQYYGGHVWVGLSRDASRWRWSLQTDNGLGGGQAEFRRWGSGEPSGGGTERCVSAGPEGFWSDRICSEPLPSVCYTGTEAVSSGLVFVEQNQTWEEARSFCREHYADLATVRSSAENDHIKTLSQNQQVWIGLNRNTWTWSDGNAASFTKWSTNRPQEDPCVLLHQGRFEDRTCDTKLYFVCQNVPKKQRVVKLTAAEWSPSVDEEAAARAALWQLRGSLKDQVWVKDVQLTWRRPQNGQIFTAERREEEKGREEISCSLQT
ncbi:uncharacterized protein V6R79_014395 [Siganus canaliculatus]